MDSNAFTVLVIDDEPDVVDLICFNLESGGLQTDRAFNGKEGFARACSTVPDAIVLDVMLPGLNGFEVLKKLRGDVRTRAIPVLMVTAKAETGDQAAGLEAGADDYLTKPFSPKELVRRIQELLAKA